MSQIQSARNQLLTAVRAYRMPEVAQQLLAEHPPLIIAGITAAGKNSVTQYILDNADYRQIVTHTTRGPREGEVDAEHYHFVSEHQMLELINRQQMIEVQAIHHSAVYGVSIAAYKKIVDAGHKALLIIDVQGVEELSKYLPKGTKPYFLLPPSFENWMQWLDKRGHMSFPEKQKRMKSAQRELDKALRSNLFQLAVNREVKLTAGEILQGYQDSSLQHKNRETAMLLAESLERI